MIMMCMSLFIYLFVCLFIFGCIGSSCCAQAFSSCDEQGLLFVAVHGLLIAVASLVAEHGLWVRGRQQLWHVGSVVVARGLSSCGLWALECRLSSCGARAQLLHSMWDFSQTRARTHVLCIGRQILNHCATREARCVYVLILV